MSKSPDAFRTISEVADWLGVQAHVLRFWESKFTQVKPVKRAGGRRYYRPNDMLLLGGIKKLLHEDGMTIKGAQKMLREQGTAAISAMSHPVDGDFDETDLIEASAESDIEVTPDPAEGMVVPFPKSQASAPAPTMESDDSDSLLSRMEVPSGSSDQTPEVAGETPSDDAAEDELAPLTASEAVAEDDDDFEEFGLGSAATTTAETPADPALTVSEPADDTAALPSFLNRRLAPAQPEAEEPATAAEADDSTAAPAPRAEPPKPRIVDAPDPPSHDQIAFVPGPLARFAQGAPITPERAPELAAVLADLRAWHKRATSALGR